MTMRATRLVALLAGLFSVAACSTGSENLDIPLTDGGEPTVDGGEPDAGDDGTARAIDAGPAPAATKCGNFKVEPGEACDDGNTNDNDGCSATCKLESAFDGDICPGSTITLQPNGNLLHGTVSGTTANAFNQYGSGCGGGSGKDVVFTLMAPTAGKAIVKLTAGYPAILSARATCDVATSETGCSEVLPATGDTTLEIPVFQNTPIFLFVDGYGGSSGAFTLDVDITQAVCGNGVAELPEKCDDGNTVDGDGCSATCELEAGGVLTQCPGQPFVLTGAAGQPRKISFAGDTHGGTAQWVADCYFGGGNTLVYAIKSDITGSVKADLVTGFTKSVFHARSDCASTAYQLGCTSKVQPGNGRLEFPVVAGRWFYLLVGADDDGGPFSLSVEVTPAACGNDTLDGNEECDDANTDTTDGCSTDCKRTPLAGLDTCPGNAVTLTAQPDGSRTAVVSGTTVGLTNDVPPCQSIQFSSAPDAVFAVTPDVDGRLTVDLTGPFNSTVSVLDRCAAPIGERSSVLGCSYASWVPPINKNDPYVIDGLGSGPKTTGVPVLANHTYFVVVDSVTSSGPQSAGPFELRMRVAPSPVCGNGVIEGAETCDDGATDDNDGCSATCVLEPTGPRDTCATVETVTLVSQPNGVWNALVKSGTTNLTPNHNFGSTATAAGGCWARGPDAYFKVVAPASGVLRATAKSTAFDVILGMQPKTCSTTTPPSACSNSGPKGTDETLAVAVTAGDVVYLVVDTPLLDVNGCMAPISSTFAADCAKLEERGRFTLDVAVAPSACGDGFFVPGPNEQCDDGNTVNDDGCSATCTLEPMTNVDVCPGRPLTFTGAGATQRKATITFSTEALNSNYSGACGGDGRDGVVSFVAPISGIARARLRGMINGTVYARRVCDDPTTEFPKSTASTCPSIVHDTVTFQVRAGFEYFVFVDGLDGAVGVPTLDVTIE
jgi:cysteine-rich repeat protein